MEFELSSTAAAIAAGLVASILLLWHAAMPKPIIGIPYNRQAAKRILGDLPDSMEIIKRTGGFLAFLGVRCDQLASPVAQVFMKPFSSPFVVVRDSRECYDILNRRVKEFDQSDFFQDQLSAVFPNSSVTMPSNEQWRYNRKLTAETMSPYFLREVAAPTIASCCGLLMELWSEKMRLAKGHPFDVNADLPKAFNDIIWLLLFGTDVGTLAQQLRLLKATGEVHLPADQDEVVEVPEAELPELFTAYRQVLDSGTISRQSPLGRWHHEFAFRFYPKLSRAWALKNRTVKESVRQAWNKYSTSERALGQRPGSIVEFVIQREVREAKREGRAAESPSKYLEGELAMMVGAGYETTSASMNWVVKYLTAFPECQARIRTSILEAFHVAREEKRDPTPQELQTADLVYLDAFVEEVLRHSHLLPAATRTAQVNTTILGYPIPKGTTVIMLLSAQHAPTFAPDTQNRQGPYEEILRTSSGTEYKSAYEHWDANDLQSFRPERYLKHNHVKGIVEFDAMAAPMLTFGGGLRACMGKKMAYLNMRIMIALIVWRFELLAVPEELSSFDTREGNVTVAKQVYLRLRDASA